MVKINWTPQAKNDLIGIAEFIGQNSRKYARIQIQRIRERVLQLKEYPNSGREVPELENPRIRELILGNYRIIYCIVSDERVDILTVHHSARLLNDKNEYETLYYQNISNSNILDVISNRERDVVRLLITKKTSDEIADVLNISKHTVDTHRRNILKKLNLSSTFELINFFKNNPKLI